MSIHLSPANDVTTLRSETTSRRKLPVNLDQDDLSLFSAELERVIPPTRLLRLRDVSVSAEGVLFQKGRMLPESFAFPHTRASWKRRSVVKFFLNNYLVRPRRRFAPASVWVTDDWSAGYFHWLADVLPRLFTMKDQLGDLVLLLPDACKELKYVSASLEPFKIGAVEFVGPGEVLVCDNLLVPTQTAPSGHYNDELIRAVGKLQVEFHASNVLTVPHTPSAPNTSPSRETPADRIYISRALAPKRKISNEEGVIEVLREFNFRVVRTEDHSFAEQVRLAAGARCVVSNHGAGLTNMLFMAPGVSVLELRHATDRINNCYFTLASALNLNYFYQSCEPENAGEDPHSADLRVDLNVLKTNLELMLDDTTASSS
jgi:capsular polysaccharide biosynthesis protein